MTCFFKARSKSGCFFTSLNLEAKVLASATMAWWISEPHNQRYTQRFTMVKQ